jgi:hypothetical protein
MLSAVTPYATPEVDMAVTFEGSAADLASFADMLSHCAGRHVAIDAAGRMARDPGNPPAAGQPLIDVLDNLIGAAENLVIHIGRHQHGVLFDSYPRRTIDLDDIEAFPPTPPPFAPGATTRCELLIHVLAEYKHAMHAGHLAGHGREGYDAAHAAGTAAQSALRSAAGQAGAAHGQDVIPGKDHIAAFRHCDGSRTYFNYDETGKLIDVWTGGEHPCDRVRRLVDEGWKDGSSVSTDENVAIDHAKSDAKTKAGKVAKSREEYHTCPAGQPVCLGNFELIVDEPTGLPVVDPHPVDAVTTRYEATIAAHWSLFLTCSPRG